ncbi:hypothetical protein DPEC_G00049210 [Dallia pectoralis]|uniref:Uncharacterized protein n=1 Tax=Dallia pectoralis TaxID=75939 RepID=A0ACC2HC03_DALPE|nr:hypothetical protein DPEC_G00049210 [Dallia pectoralis]
MSTAINPPGCRGSVQLSSSACVYVAGPSVILTLDLQSAHPAWRQMGVPPIWVVPHSSITESLRYSCDLCLPVPPGCPVEADPCSGEVVLAAPSPQLSLC